MIMIVEWNGKECDHKLDRTELETDVVIKCHRIRQNRTEDFADLCSFVPDSFA